MHLIVKHVKEKMKKTSKAEIAKKIKTLDAELLKKVSDLESTYKDKKSAVIEKYTRQTSQYKKGDVISDGHNTIKIDHIGYKLRNDNLMITYTGDRYSRGSRLREDDFLFNDNRRETLIDVTNKLKLVKKMYGIYPLIIDEGEDVYLDSCVEYSNGKPDREVLEIPVKYSGVIIGHTNKNADTITFIDNGIVANLLGEKHLTVSHRYKCDTSSGVISKDKELNELVIFTKNPDRGFPIKNITGRTCKKAKTDKYYH